MITNARIKQLIETDREALVVLMATAYAAGSQTGYGYWLSDPDIRILLDEVRRRAGERPLGPTLLSRWNALSEPAP